MIPKLDESDYDQMLQTLRNQAGSFRKSLARLTGKTLAEPKLSEGKEKDVLANIKLIETHSAELLSGIEGFTPGGNPELLTQLTAMTSERDAARVSLAAGQKEIATLKSELGDFDRKLAARLCQHGIRKEAVAAAVDFQPQRMGSSFSDQIKLAKANSTN